MRSPGRELVGLLGAAVPADDARQTVAERHIELATGRRADGRWRVLDLGCGTGDSVDAFRARDPAVQWIGLDIEGSRESLARTRDDARFERFDGITIPFEAERFDLVYCKQALEHVRSPAPLLAEVARVLARTGAFAGSTSQLEPFHSDSYWNYTPLGFMRLLEDAGMTLREIRPGIDSATLIARRLAGSGPRRDRRFAAWWGNRSPLNRALDLYGTVRGVDSRTLNATKLLFCGQFAFSAVRRGCAHR